MADILHITPHFGGGVGTVLRALIDGISEKTKHNQDVVSFEYLNKKTKEWFDSKAINVYSEILPDNKWLLERVVEADIVHIHFWNHPSLYYFLYTMSARSARVILWSHVNGHYAPYLFNEAVVNFPMMFVASTMFSLSQKVILQKSEKWKSHHIRVVHSTAGLSGFDKISRGTHSGINVGYVGTVDYAKMHRDFIDILASVEHPDMKIIVCGGNDHEELRIEANKKGVADRFDFLGHVEDVKRVFSMIDIFAYPLARENYGTGEQVLIEAMSAGIPQIVFADGPEEIVVENGTTGIVCKSTNEFTNAINQLCNNKDLYERMQKASKERAKKVFNFEKSLKKWLSIYDELLLINKSTCHFQLQGSGDIGMDLFFLSLGECKVKKVYEEILQYYPHDIPKSLLEKVSHLPSIFKGSTRGSVRHYYSFFKSKKLLYLANQV